MRKAIGITVLAASLTCGAAALADPTITEFDAPGAHTTNVAGIGNGGDITGVYVLAGGGNVGYVRKSDGSFVFFDQPAARPLAVNAKGETAGLMQDASDDAFFAGADGTVSAFRPPDWGRFFTVADAIDGKGTVAGNYYDTHLVSRGFLRGRGGRIVSFDAPGAGTKREKGTFVTGLASGDIAAGYVVDNSNADHGFVRAKDGSFTMIDIAGASTKGTHVLCMSANATAGGYYWKSRGVAHAFLRDLAGNISTFNARNAVSTVVQGVNSKGFAVGYWLPAKGAPHGFVRTPLGHIVTFDAPDAGTAPSQGTFPTGINDKGEIAGYYTDSADIQHGFFRTK
jgi:hypothetical protein